MAKTKGARTKTTAIEGVYKLKNCMGCDEMIYRTPVMVNGIEVGYKSKCGGDWLLDRIRGQICPDCVKLDLEAESRVYNGRKCLQCNAFLTSSRWNKCATCKPDLGDSLLDGMI
jgi:hypothetical protein